MSKLKSYNKLIIVSVLALSFLVRIYRLPQLLGFWYDQGRDALVIWDLIEKGKMFLIGPMMGFTGIFRGPWYYYLITPAYYLGKGDPLWANLFLISLTIWAIYILYKVGKEIGGEKTGLVSAFVASFSVYIIGASRWFSNPTPTLLIGISLVWAVFRFIDGKRWAVPLIAFLVGMGLNFGAATELYYIPALLIIFYQNKKMLPGKLTFLLSFFIFWGCFAPQILFELRHPGVMTGALYNFIFKEKTFTFNFIEMLSSRTLVYYNLFYSKFWTEGPLLFAPFFGFFLIALVVKWKKYMKNLKVKALFILFLAPFVGTLFFVSNLGAFYDYYFTAYYLVFILCFVFVLLDTSKKVTLLFLMAFLYKNYQGFNRTYNVNLNDPETIAYENQLKAIDWIYKDSGDNKFNVDVYVPPVVPYAYDYLFKWQEKKRGSLGNLTDNKVGLLYTLYEVDPPHPERLDAWLERQKGIGNILKTERFGGIVVQKRDRVKYE